jgi:hypothetical protein
VVWFGVLDGSRVCAGMFYSESSLVKIVVVMFFRCEDDKAPGLLDRKRRINQASN